MPLSEDEQRILSEIEQQLRETDPGLARDIADTTVYTAASRGLKWSAFGFFVGLILLVVLLGTSFLLAFGGFLVMLISALAFERNGRRLGKAGMQQMTQWPRLQVSVMHLATRGHVSRIVSSARTRPDSVCPGSTRRRHWRNQDRRGPRRSRWGGCRS